MRVSLCLAAVTATIYLVLVGVYFGLYPNVELRSLVDQAGVSTGASLSQGMSFLLVRIDSIQSLFPGLLVFVIGFLYCQVVNKENHNKPVKLAGLMIYIGLLGWLLWVLKAPITHVRYLWPSMPALLFGGLILMGEHMAQGERGSKLLLKGLVLSLTLVTIAQEVRQISIGESLAIAYKYAGVLPSYRENPPFTSKELQNATAKALLQVPSEVAIYTNNEILGYPLSYLTGRQIKAFTGEVSSGEYFLVLPGDLDIWPISPSVATSLTQKYSLLAASGEYYIYKAK